MQSVKSPSYLWDGANRHDGPVHCIFQYTLSGYGVFCDGKGRHIVSEGKGFLCESDDPRTKYFFPEESRTEWKFVYLAFKGAVAHQMVRQMVRKYGGLYTIPAEHPLIRRLQSYLDYSRPLQTMAASAGLRLVSDLICALAESNEEKRIDCPGYLLIKKAGRMLGRLPGTSMSVTQLAAALGVSREHLSRVFRKSTGQTPLAFMTRRKIVDACRLLEESKTSIKEISDGLGFPNQSHFTRTFRRVTGKSPSEFRENPSMPVFD